MLTRPAKLATLCDRGLQARSTMRERVCNCNLQVLSLIMYVGSRDLGARQS